MCKKVDNIEQEILSSNTKQLDVLLNRLRDHGTSKNIPELLNALNKTEDSEKQNKLISFLGDIKYNEASDYFVEAIKSEEYSKIKGILIRLCWESGLSFTKHLISFIEWVSSSDFEISFEAFTVIENMYGKLSIEDKEEARTQIQEKLNGDIESPQKEFLHDLLNIVPNIEEERKHF